MIYLIILIVVLTIILYVITKDKKLVLKLSGDITIFSGLLTILIGLIIRYITMKEVTTINLSAFTITILINFIRNALILISLGFFELAGANLIKS